MDRRRFLLTSLGGVLATPLTVGAQPAGKVWRLAWLGEGVGIAPAEFFLRPFIEGLRDLGYIEGQHFTLVLRFAGANPECLREMAAELVGLKPDLIAAPGTQALLALSMRTSTIPIVMVYPGDPVGTGIVSSLSRPGGNVTGTSLMSSEVSGKRLQILRELVPGLRRVAVIWNPNNASTGSDMRATEGIAKSMGLQVQPVPVDGTGRMNDALSDVARLRPEGILAIQDAHTSASA
jgi:putative ABC transport system substrate-binding protein